MGWMQGIAAGLSFVSAIVGYRGGKKAEDAADEQGRREQKLEQRVTQEKLRQLDVQEEALKGETIARTAGSGVRVDYGSPLMVLAEQAKEFAYERSVTRDVGASRAATALARGKMIGDQARYQGYQIAASSLRQMFSILG